MTKATWEIGKLSLRPALVWSMAISSLRIRMGRSLLTCLTIATATAFMMYLLSMPAGTGESDRQSWKLMLVLSLVVSAAGVLNAMLMSVTQRYREIGTIKCLGGLDSLVLASVLTEAAILGLAGAVVGVVAGAAVSVALVAMDSTLTVAGDMAFHRWPLNALWVLLVGMGLTTLGAAVPAYIASRMPPVEAMRGEK